MHVSDIGLRGAPDTTVLAAADEDNRILITADTDFGKLLALSEASRPSVILLRRPGRRSAERAQIVLDVLDEALHRGAVVTVETTRIRVRELRRVYGAIQLALAHLGGFARLQDCWFDAPSPQVRQRDTSQSKD